MNFSVHLDETFLLLVRFIVIGAWVAVSPWLIQAMPDRAISASLLIVGIATIVLDLWELRSDPELHR